MYFKEQENANWAVVNLAKLRKVSDVTIIPTFSVMIAILVGDLEPSNPDHFPRCAIICYHQTKYRSKVYPR